MKNLEFINDPDFIIAKVATIFLSCFIAFSVFFDFLLYAILGMLLLISSIAWLALRNKFILDNSNVNDSSRPFMVLSIVFFILITYSIILLYTRQLVYYRPFEYFIIISIISGILSLEIICLPSKKHALAVIPQIIILASILVFSQVSLYPTVVGMDTWFHQMVTMKMISIGSIPSGTSYSMLPIFHLDIGTAILVTGLNYNIASVISVGIFRIIFDTLVVYGLGKHLFNERIGLLASLFLSVTNYHINMSIWPIPNALGFIYVIAIIFLVIIFKDKKSTSATLLVLLFMIILVMTHTIAAVCLAVFLLAWIASNGYYTLIVARIKNNKNSFGLFLLLISLMLGWWAYASGSSLYNLTSWVKWGFSRDYLAQVAVPLENTLRAYTESIPFEEKIFTNLGFFIFSSLAYFGYLCMISRNYKKSNIFSFALSGAIIFLIPFITTITDKSLIEGRWFSLAVILGAVPLAISISISVSTIKNKKVKLGMLSIVTLLFTFMMIMSPLANIDGPILSSDTSIRSAFTTGEMIGASFVISHYVDKLSSDYDFASSYDSVIKSYYYVESTNITSFDVDLINGSFHHDGTVIILRTQILNHPFVVSSAPYKLDYDPRIAMESEGFNQIYVCPDEVAYT
ncbi:MAG: hypothetical protein SA339_04040 [Methanomassiliicoccus sp.]|nr:hypothetical protein [Methanomassiliicoccus sp.]